MKKIVALAALMLIAGGCVNSPIAFRSVVTWTEQKAYGTTEGTGTITNNPTSGNSNVEAPKTTTDSYKPDTDANVLNGN